MSKYARNVAKVVALTSVATLGVVAHDMLDSDNMVEAHGAGFDCYDEQENGFIDGIKDFSMSETGDFCLWVKDDGTAWFRGSNHAGQAGTDILGVYQKPIQVNINKRVKRVFAGKATSFFVTEDNKVYSCGFNKYGECGVNSSDIMITSPTLVEGLEDVVEVKTYYDTDIVFYDASSYNSYDNSGTYLKTSSGNLYVVGDIHSEKILSPRLISTNVVKFEPISYNYGVAFIKSDSALYQYGWINNGTSYTVNKLRDNVSNISRCGSCDEMIVTTLQGDVLSLNFKGTTRYDLPELQGVAKKAVYGIGHYNQIYYIGKTDSKLYRKRYGSNDAVECVTEISEPIKDILNVGETFYVLTESGNLYASGKNNGTFGNGSINPSAVSTFLKIASNIRDIYPSCYALYAMTRDSRLISTGWVKTEYQSTTLYYPKSVTKNDKLFYDETSLIVNGTTKTMDSIDNNLSEYKKFGSSSSTLYGNSFYDNKVMSYNGEGNFAVSNFVEDDSVQRRQVMPNGVVFSFMEDGSIYKYDDMSVLSGTQLSLNASDIDHFELGYLNSKWMIGEETEVILAFKTDGSIYYLPRTGTSLTRLSASGTISHTLPYKSADALMKAFYYVKSTGDIGYYTSGRVFTSIGLNENDIKATIPCTSNSSDIFVMNDGSLKYIDRGTVKDITLPSGMTSGRVLSNRFITLKGSDNAEKVYYIYNNTLYATGKLKSDVDKVCNDVIMFKDATIKRANGTSLSDIDVAPDFIVNLVAIDNNNTYILNDDNSTYGVGNLLGNSSLLDFNIDYNEIAGFISNNSSTPTNKLLIMRDGTVYVNPASWTKSETIHLTSATLNDIQSSYGVTFDIVDNGLTEATSLVEQAEADIVPDVRATSTESDIASAQTAIDECVDNGVDIGDLQERLDNVQHYVTADDAVKTAETSRLSTDIASARALITEQLIPNETYRNRLTARLDALETLIQTETEAQANVNEALRAMKEELHVPMKSAYDTAKTKVDALSSGTLKTNLQTSLGTVLTYYNKFKPIQVEVEGVVSATSTMTIDNVTDIRTRYNTVLGKINSQLEQDYLNTETLRGMLTAIDDDITDKEQEKAQQELQSNALALLEKAEADIEPDVRDADTEADIELAGEAINQLTDTLKTQYNTRLTQVKNYVKADDLVIVAEGSLLQSDVTSAKSANTSTKIKNASYRERLTNRLNAITSLNKAIAGKKTKMSEALADLITTASEAVDLISDDVPAKAEHTAKLDEVQGFYDEFNPIEIHVYEVVDQADTVTASNVLEVKENYNSALEEVTDLYTRYDAENEGYTNIVNLKTDLERAYRYIDSADQDRLAEIRRQENEAEALVNEAYALRLTDKTTNFTALKTAYNTAKTAVTALSDSDSAEKKEQLLTKLDEINEYYKRLINAETKVVSAETANPKTQRLVDNARTYIQDTTVDVPLVDTAENTIYLLDRLQDVQDDINRAIHDATVEEVQVKLDELLALRYTDITTNYTDLQSKITEVQNEIDTKFVGDAYASDLTNFTRQVQEVSAYRGILLDAEAKVILAETEPLEQSKVTTARDFITSSSLKQDAVNTLKLLSRLSDVDDTIEHRGQIAEAENDATSYVERAEELQYTDVTANFTDLESAYNLAVTKVNALTDESATVKADLTTRLSAVNAYYNKLIEAETKVVASESENPKTQETVDTARGYINDNLVADKANTIHLLNRLNDVQNEINRANHDRTVDEVQIEVDDLLALRYTDVSVNYTVLEAKITDVRNSIATKLADSSFDTERTNFTTVVDGVETYRGVLLDAEAKVIDAEASPRTQAKVDTARNFITSSDLKQDAVNTLKLLSRLTDVTNAITAEAESNAESLVEIAEQARYTDLAESLLTKYNTANTAVEALGDGTVKDDLTARLVAVNKYYNRLNEAEQKVGTAESTKTRADVTTARTFITDEGVEVPLKQDASNTLDLLRRLTIVDDDITATELRQSIQEATEAVEEAERARYTGTSDNLLDKYNIADTKVTALTDCTEKSDLRGRLDQVSAYHTKLKNAEDKVTACENESPKQQSSVDSARAYINDNLKSDAQNTRDLLDRLIDVEDEINHENRINNLDALIREAEDAEKTDLASDLLSKYNRANDKLSELGESDSSYSGFRTRLDNVLAYHAKLNEAETKVANAERTLETSDVTDAEGYINANLFPRDVAVNTANLLDRLNIVKDIIQGNEDLREASEAVTRAERTMTYTDFNTAQGLVTALSPSDGKTNLQNRLDILAQKMQERLDQAIQAVEQAEANPTTDTVDNGYTKVNILPDDCTQKQGLLDRLGVLNARLERERKEQEAERAVEKAEETIKQEDIDTAREKVSALDDGDKKTELTNRLDAVQDLADRLAQAEQAVEKAEDTLKQADVDTARGLVDALPECAKKTELTARLDEVQRIIDNLLNEATRAVEKVEQTLGRNDYNTADNLVSHLEDSTDKTALETRLETVRGIMQGLIADATAKVETAEQNPSRDAVNVAQTAIDRLPDDYVEKQPLQDRLNAVIAGLDLQDLIDLATRAVEKAESTRNMTDINSAQDLVNRLPDGEVKTELQRRLDALLADMNLQDLIRKATEKVEEAEDKRTQATKDDAQSWVNRLPDGQPRRELQQRLDAIIIETPKTNYTQQELQQILNDIVKGREVTNSTTKETLADDIKTEFTRRTNVPIDIFISDWNKVNSTNDADGKITGKVVGVVELTNLNSAQLQCDMNLKINREPVISSSGHKKSSTTTVVAHRGVNFQLIGIARNDVASDVSISDQQTTESNEADLLSSNNDALKIVNVPYLEKLTSDDGSVNGTMQLLNINESTVGMILTGDKEYAKDTVVSINTDADVTNLKVYTYISEIDKYVEVKTDLSKDDGILKFRGTGKSKYILSTVDLSENITANQNWNKVEGDNWTYVKGQDVASNWVTDVDNHKYYIDANTHLMKDGWLKENNDWYYLNPISDGTRGAMKTGWVSTRTDWYFMDNNGKMQTGWIRDRGAWYHLSESGAMTVGWIQDSGKWYYTESSGVMLTGYQSIDGVVYHFDSNGALIE